MSAAGSPEVAQAIAKASRHQPDPDIDLNGRRTGKDRCAACSWPWPCDTSILRDALAAAADREARVRALHQPEGPCSCGGRRWVEDEGWSPEDYERNQPRSEGAGLVPCGFCNPGGWNVDQYAPDPPRCDHDEELWPCPTIAALDPAGQDPT